MSDAIHLEIQVAIFFLMGIAGVAVSAANLWVSAQLAGWFGNLHVEGPRLIVVRSGAAMNTLYLLCHIVFLLMGIGAIISIIPLYSLPYFPKISIINLATNWGLVAAQALLVTAAEISRRARLALLAAIDREEARVSAEAAANSQAPGQEGP